MYSHRRQAVVLVALMGIVALVAQLAGISSRTTATNAGKRVVKARTLAVVPGGAVPDIMSTTLASKKIRAGADDTVRMTGAATLRLRKAARGATQVVCGIRYTRDGDPSWSLGTPYETVTVPRSGKVKRVKIARSFTAPAADTYRMRTSCHVTAPERGAKVSATGTMQLATGLPKGAATPVE